MHRPHFKKSIQELEEIVANANGEDELCVIAQELEHRNTKRAQNLMSSVQKKLPQDTKSSLFNSVAAGPQNAASDDPVPTSVETEKEDKEPQDLNLEKLYDDIELDTDDPVIARLASWITLEALSPQTYRRPEDLVSGDCGRVAKLKDGLPWTRKESSRKNYKLYYEVTLGAIDMDLAEERLIQLFGQDEEKQRRGQTKAAIASILVDKEGYLVDEGGVSVSSFAWALPLCLTKRFDVLGSWPKVQESITPALENMLKRQDKEGNDLPLDKNAIWNAYKWLVEQFDIPSELITPPEFCLRIYHYYKAPNAPECSLLNSFFIEDLSEAVGKYQNGLIGEGLRKYLGKTAPSQALDLLEDNAALEEVLSPKNVPLARWPMGSDRALVLLQQAAVNAASTELKDKGILSVNGPPGTGKTTLLRDIISHVVVERASAMCSFENPVDAFTTTGEKVTTGASGFWQIYSLDPKIKGHEILVASSNNSAEGEQVSMTREIVFDTETTGMDPFAGDRIIEIGAVELINHLPSGKTLQLYINPERDVPPEATAVHGITNDFLKDKPVFSQVYSEFIEFIGSDGILVAHNAAFDMKFVNWELQQVGHGEIPDSRVVDTLKIARRKFPGSPANLDALCRRYNIDLAARTFHGALLDSELLAEVYLELLGGRQHGLGLGAEEGVKGGPVRTQSAKIREFRPPRAHSASPEERAAHEAFLAQLIAPLWEKTGNG